MVTDLSNGRGCCGLIGMPCSSEILCVDKRYLLPTDWSALFVATDLVAWNTFAVCCLELGLQRLFKVFSRKVYLELCQVVCWNIHTVSGCRGLRLLLGIWFVEVKVFAPEFTLISFKLLVGWDLVSQ